MGARKLQKGDMWRLRRDDAPAEWGGYNERKRDRHASRCSHTLLTCSYPPHAVRAPQILQLSGMRPIRIGWESKPGFAFAEELDKFGSRIRREEGREAFGIFAAANDGTHHAEVFGAESGGDACNKNQVDRALCFRELQGRGAPASG